MLASFYVFLRLFCSFFKTPVCVHLLKSAWSSIFKKTFLFDPFFLSTTGVSWQDLHPVPPSNLRAGLHPHHEGNHVHSRLQNLRVVLRCCRVISSIFASSSFLYSWKLTCWTIPNVVSKLGVCKYTQLDEGILTAVQLPVQSLCLILTQGLRFFFS